MRDKTIVGVRFEHIVSKRIKQITRTLAAIPGEMADAVERVEGKRRSEDGLTSKFDRLRKRRDRGDDVGRGEGRGRDEVAERETVEDCDSGLANGSRR